MRGKKFDAHEKHFKEKEIKLNKQIKHTEEVSYNLYQNNQKLIKENNNLIKENLEIKEKYEKLLEVSKLSDKETKELLQFNKSVNQMSSFLNLVNIFWRKEGCLKWMNFLLKKNVIVVTIH